MFSNIIIPFAGGLGMFIYGMHIMAQGLENAAGSRMKASLEALTRNKLTGVLLGAVITAVIQSSSATTVMVVGFVNAGIMDLTQAMSVIIGANIGTTVTGWIVSSVEWARYLNPATLAPVAIIVGVIMMLIARKNASKEIAKIILGFGLLFVGITTMSEAVVPLRESSGFAQLFVMLGTNPLFGILAGACVTAIIQSSSASVGILQSLASAGLVPFNAGIYIIMGQNIGTCVTALISGIGAKKAAKTAGLMHLLFNIIGTLVFSIASIAYIKILDPAWALSGMSQTDISLIHTLFNVATTILLLPFSGSIIKLSKKLSNLKDEAESSSITLLDERMMETPGIAIASLRSEILRMGDLTDELITSSHDVLLEPDRDKIAYIKESEDHIDRFTDDLSDYAVKLSSLPIYPRERKTIAYMLKVISDMERICDHCDNMGEFAEKIIDDRLSFSDTAKKEIDQMIEVAQDSYRYALKAFRDGSIECIEKAFEKESRADQLEQIFRNRHIERMVDQKCDARSGVIFIDILNSMERISDHARNIAESVLEDIDS